MATQRHRQRSIEARKSAGSSSLELGLRFEAIRISRTGSRLLANTGRRTSGHLVFAVTNEIAVNGSKINLRAWRKSVNDGMNFRRTEIGTTRRWKSNGSAAVVRHDTISSCVPSSAQGDCHTTTRQKSARAKPKSLVHERNSRFVSHPIQGQQLFPSYLYLYSAMSYGSFRRHCRMLPTVINR